MPAAGQPLPKMDNSFVLPRHKVVYVSVAKVACTSMRWMVADLAGEDLESFRQMSGGGQSRLMNIHGHRSRFKHSTSMNHLPPDQVAQISGANGWFVFGLVRNP